MQRFFATILLLITLPVLLIAGVLIVATSGFPIVFRQSRVGYREVPFVVYKLRTMTNGKITIIGNLLRKTGIDELPQLVNIMKGEMHFVGPRPLTSTDVERLQWIEAKHRIRWSVKPGITGLAQLTNVCDADVSFANDKLYAENRSIGLDLKIILRSALIPFIGKSTAKNLIHKSA